jgi:hypothetical protein
VTLELALRRPSHVPVVLNVLARRRCPIHPLQCARCTSSITRRVRAAKAAQHAHDGIASRRGSDECAVPPLEIEVQAIQLSPYRAGLAERHPTRLPMAPASPTCSCPLRLSPSGKSDDPEASLRTSPDCVRDSAPRPAAHPFSASGGPTPADEASFSHAYSPFVVAASCCPSGSLACPECLDPFPLWQPFSASLDGRDSVE